MLLFHLLFDFLQNEGGHIFLGDHARVTLGKGLQLRKGGRNGQTRYGGKLAEKGEFIPLGTFTDGLQNGRGELKGRSGREHDYGLGGRFFFVCLADRPGYGGVGIHQIAVLFPYVLFTQGINLSSLDVSGWGCLVTVGVVHTGIAYCMYFSSLGSLPGQRVAILSYIDPLVAVLLSVFVLGEKMLPIQIVGGALILGFTLWNEIGIKKKQ